MRTTNVIFWMIVGIFLVRCGTTEMNSKWKDREIKIDGYQDDWKEALTYLEDKKLSVGFLNDNHYLYACLVTGDRRTQSQISRLGFTLWVDAKGGKDKKHGIRFPIGMKDMDPAMLREMMRNQQVGRLRDLLQTRFNEIEILGANDKDRRREPIQDLVGLEIKMETSLDLLIYEIKVPLSQNDQNTFSVAANPGDLIGIGLETGEINMENLQEQMGEEGSERSGARGGMRGGGRRGGGDRQGGGPGGEMRSGMPMPEQLKIWAKVQLAAQ